MAVLMVSSQLLLTGFVVYWLVNQYHAEQRHLHVNLQHEYLSTHEQLIDSVILKELIRPTLNDTVVIRMDVTGNRANGFPLDTSETSVTMAHFQLDSTHDKQVFALRLGELHTLDSLRIDSTIHSTITDQEMLVRSVKLFIDQTDESFRADPSAHVFSMQVDHATFQNLLDERFSSLGWNFLLDSMDEDLSISDIKIGFNTDLIYYYVSKYQR